MTKISGFVVSRFIYKVSTLVFFHKEYQLYIIRILEIEFPSIERI